MTDSDPPAKRRVQGARPRVDSAKRSSCRCEPDIAARTHTRTHAHTTHTNDTPCLSPTTTTTTTTTAPTISTQTKHRLLFSPARSTTHALTRLGRVVQRRIPHLGLHQPRVPAEARALSFELHALNHCGTRFREIVALLTHRGTPLAMPSTGTSEAQDSKQGGS